MEEIKLYILHLNQDDPKKCTAKKLGRFNYAKLTSQISHIPRGSIILSPYTRRVLSPADRRTAERQGVSTVDCSWKNAREVFYRLRGNFRRLPYLLAVNPTNWGHPWQLSSAEALAAALYILGYKEQAHKIMNIFKWGPNFFVMNREPLEAYANSSSWEEVLDAESEFM
ncbi:conserved domain protein [Aciduliprofundum boonei T469]|nr:conserved domain protein [Aciduliprofundum boonei T469]